MARRPTRSVLALPLALGALVATACQSYPFVYAGTDATVVATQRELVGQGRDTDILFVIDNSGSMADKQADLQRNAQAFIDELVRGSNTFHLGITTTDIVSATDNGRLRLVGSGSVDPAQGAYISAPAASDPQATQKRADAVAAFIATVGSLGTGGSGNEAGIGGALAALAPTDPSIVTHNAGFLRPDADLAVIIVSDEDDCSPRPESYAQVEAFTGDDDCYVAANADKLLDPNTIVARFAALKGGDIGRVRLALITGGTVDANGTLQPHGCMVGSDGKPSDACGCWLYSQETSFCGFDHDLGQACVDIGTCTGNTCPSQSGGACDTPLCPATAARRYTTVLQSFIDQRKAAGLSAGTFADSICQVDYHQSLVSIAREVVLSSCFTLPAPVQSTADIAVQLTRPDASGVYGAAQVVPVLDAAAAASASSCQSCGACPTGAWQLAGPRSVCLTCGLTKLPGDFYDVSALDEKSSTTLPGH